ncbi:Fe-S-containing hydro-lyase [Hujiaoplasma nucleasis]|uniref:Fe-S-containing hydro-lyase n=1 Tax=Hujiaoplasma nucleasis TaxID=2725268 RepID=A0A7L6N1H3_9MOLU|nr:Fe-S-containing hydro-lyase [Hujiaoplasma nucleasis]QLY39431.1 Fe-S-containing hydro-lyase [Hujiaoplasma nucleasis]
MEKKLTTPISDELRRSLRAGEEVLITGYIYTGRDAAHKLLIDAIDNNQELPFDVKDQVIYYVGPTPARPGQVIGACGPTSSYRMDQFSPKLMDKGLKVMIGKGPRSQEFIEELKKHQAVYLLAIGGLGAKLSQAVKENITIAYPHLESEAIRQLKVVEFPAIVAIDSLGQSVF